MLIFAVPPGKCRINMSLFKLQHADERTRSNADRFSFFTLRFLGAEVTKITILIIMHLLSLKGVGHILTFKPQWLLR
jgi:hypothetical protein